MDKVKDQLRFTEAERIEFNRRTDIAFAIVPAANAKMQLLKELSDSIAVKSKRHASYWYLTAGAIGYCVHYFISGDKFVFDFGTFIVLMVALHWVGGQIDLHSLKRQQFNERQYLADLQTTWRSAVGDSDDFWQIGKFEIFGKLDLQDNDVAIWWEAQTASILLRVCDVERGLEMAREWEAQRAAWRLHKSSLETPGRNDE